MGYKKENKILEVQKYAIIPTVYKFCSYSLYCILIFSLMASLRNLSNQHKQGI